MDSLFDDPHRRVCDHHGPLGDLLGRNGHRGDRGGGVDDRRGGGAGGGAGHRRRRVCGLHDGRQGPGGGGHLGLGGHHDDRHRDGRGVRGGRGGRGRRLGAVGRHVLR